MTPKEKQRAAEGRAEYDKRWKAREEHYAKRRPHEVAAERAFGREAVFRLFQIAREARVSVSPRVKKRIRSAERRLSRALAITDAIEKEIGEMGCDPFGVFDSEYLMRALDDVRCHADSIATFLNANRCAAKEGRPSARAQFVRAARAAIPAICEAGEAAWAHLGIAVGIDDPESDFRNLSDSYGDLLNPRGGKPRPTK